MNYKRLKVQILGLIIANSFIFSPFLKYVPCPVMNCYACPLAAVSCPVGTIQSLISLGTIPIYTMGLLAFVGSMVGRMSCGWICPFGFLQELAYKVPIWKLKISNRYAALSYAFLGLVLLYPLAMFLIQGPVEKFTLFCKLCPVGTLEGGIPSMLLYEGLRKQIGLLFISKVSILMVLIALVTMIKMPFCRFICPLGAIFSLFNPISRVRLDVDDSCTKCGRCAKACPVDAEIYMDPDSRSCIRCLDCTKTCSNIRLTKR